VTTTKVVSIDARVNGVGIVRTLTITP
jgi:hypothetical protein